MKLNVIYKEMPKAYDPSISEDKWIKYWEESKLYESRVDYSKKPYTIVIPPPNVTGILTMGHILNNTIQDVYIRYKRMQGYNACWVPGTDHASIATEAKVTAYLKEKGIEKKQIGREKFLEHCWEWTRLYGGIITKQLRKLGVSCDWSRERFTMDDHYYRKVIEAFVKLYKKGLIYRGYRLVNWCPVSKSAISDEEVIYKQTQGKLWHLRYPLKDSDRYLIVATTRPETMLGDTAVAVNPKDKRYSDLIGKKILLPIVNREIPIIADEYVDPSFGSGAVKVTPAHDFNDYEIGLRHNLQMINIFTSEARTNENVPEDLRNLDRYEARKKVIEKFQELDLLEKVEDYANNVGYSERGGVPIEPYLSEQWFLKMKELAEPALRVVKEGKIKFYPEHWIKTYEHWMTNIKDWCISRQLWWGHRIPVWRNKKTGEIYCEVDPPEGFKEGESDWEQDLDVLDTWASSWLWAHEVFTTEEDQKYYYPTDLLVTGPDIIFFWVARMIMAGLEFMGDIPFRDVYYTSIIRDIQGRKMSKSLGNSPDPLDVIKDYGADALRFTILYIASIGQDVLFSVEKCEIGRNFCNKLWNAARFLMMNIEKIEVDYNLLNKHSDIADKWIFSKLNSTIKNVVNALDKYEINNAVKLIYDFVWKEYCDWYIEIMKNKIAHGSDEQKTAALSKAVYVFEQSLKLLHPFMPFITEELWSYFFSQKNSKSISIDEYPKADDSYIDEAVEKEFEFLQKIVSSIRVIRGENNIHPAKKIDVTIKIDSLNENISSYIKSLAKIENLTFSKNLIKPKLSASAIVDGIELFAPLEGIIDIQAERKRLIKEIEKLEAALIPLQKKLSNRQFVENAPADIVLKEKEKETLWKENLAKLKEALNMLND